MLTFLFYSLIFFCGMIAAYVNWEQFVNEVVSFKHVKNPVRAIFQRLVVDDQWSLWDVRDDIPDRHIRADAPHIPLPGK